MLFFFLFLIIILLLFIGIPSILVTKSKAQQTKTLPLLKYSVGRTDPTQKISSFALSARKKKNEPLYTTLEYKSPPPPKRRK